MSKEEVIDVVSLYNELEKATLARSSTVKGEKATQIREFVVSTAKTVGKSRLAVSATLNLMKKVNPDMKLDRTHFTSTVSRTWEVEKDGQGHVWILVDQEKQKSK